MVTKTDLKTSQGMAFLFVFCVFRLGYPFDLQEHQALVSLNFVPEEVTESLGSVFAIHFFISRYPFMYQTPTCMLYCLVGSGFQFWLD